ncbi:hypothetical protein ACFYXF_44560 [Streptomyces sp. NPDC002680]|uniref:hypothetical protein n=1 Tax=Streptomyces sp. NPDC002680 TaxID=3364659 RepID=UPI00369C2919
MTDSSRARTGAARATAAAVLGVVAAVALAGCAVPGGSDEPPAVPPASAPPVRPSSDGESADAAGRPTGAATAVEPTPEALPADPTPTAATPRPTPSRSAPAASPKAKLPDLSLNTSSPSPSSSPRATPPEPSSTTPRAETSDGRSLDGSTTLRIGSWSARVVRGGQEAVDECRDAVLWTGPDLGTTEDGFALRTAVVVGHDYCGFDRFAELPVGTVVTATTPRGTFAYRVYARHVSPGRGTPSHGLYWGDLTLQSCVGPDTGFSYLMRV